MKGKGRRSTAPAKSAQSPRRLTPQSISLQNVRKASVEPDVVINILEDSEEQLNRYALFVCSYNS